MERHVRCIIPPRVSPGQRWHVVQHKKFLQRLSRTQKRRMQRQKATDRCTCGNPKGGGHGIRESEGTNGS